MSSHLRRLLMLALAAVAACAQTNPSSPLGGPDDSPVRLERYEVTGIPLQDSVNPLTRPLEGVFGDPRSLLDTPRSASTITAALLRERGIEGVREFVAFAPGSAAPASYGKATIPTLRGDLAETFLNGQRLSYNNFGYLPSFNNVEAIDVVRGPGSAIYGSGFLTGGYVNYLTKQPRFTPETTITLRAGSWVPGGGSWLNESWQIDTTAPLPGGRSAWRFSYEGKEDDTFFRAHGGRDDREDLYCAFTSRVSDALTIEANAQYLWQAAPQLLGVNRPNQELIDHGRYYTDDLPDLGFSDAGAIAGTIAGTSWVDLPRDATLLSVGDYSYANIARAQVIATLRLAPTQQLINRTLFENVDRRRYHAFEYAEWAQQRTFEHRTEWHAGFGTPGRGHHQLVAGATVRWEARLSYTNYFNEYFFQYDLTRTNRRFSHAENYPNSYWPGLPGPGGVLYFPASDGSPETTDSRLWNPAVFLQDDIQLTDRLSLLAGLRVDGFFARARDPLGAAAGTNWSDRRNDSATSWNASLRYRLNPKATVYLTHQRAYAVHGNVTGGGIMLKDDGTGRGVIDAADFKNLSRLTELGVKCALWDNQLYAGAALFEQQRDEPELGGGVQKLKVRGGELELVYQPTTRFNATANVALTDGRFDHSTASEAGGTSLYNLYAAGAGPGGRGNGVGFTWDTHAPGDYRLPGLSRWVVNGSFSYRFVAGFGGGLNGSWQSEQRGNLANEYHLPAQVFLNAFLFYRRPRWEIDVEILNVLDRRNWIHNGDNYSNNMLVFQDLPRRVEGYVKFRF